MPTSLNLKLFFITVTVLAGFGIFAGVPASTFPDFEYPVGISHVGPSGSGMPRAADLGASFTKLAAAWCAFEIVNDVWDWDRPLITSEIPTAIQNGLPVMVQLGIRGWGIGQGQCDLSWSPGPPLDLSQSYDPQHAYSQLWYDFCYNFSGRLYHEFGENVPYYLIENELALRFEELSADEYLRVLRTSYQAIKASAADHNADLQVSNDGHSSPTWGICIVREMMESGQHSEQECLDYANGYFATADSESIPVFETYQQLIDTVYSPQEDGTYQFTTYLLAHLGDAWGPYATPPLDTYNLHFYEQPWYLKDVADWIREKMKEAGYELPLIISELGIRDGRDENPYPYDTEVQAADVIKMVMAALRAEISVVNWWQLVKQENPSDKVALMSDDYQRYPAADAMEFLLERWVNNDYRYDHESAATANLVRNVLARRDTGMTDVECLWWDDGSHGTGQGSFQLEAPPGANGAIIYDYAGHETAYDVSGGYLAVTVSQMPVYLQWVDMIQHPSALADSGDYDGDGKSDLAVFRPADALWAVRGVTRLYLGSRGDLPVPGDYNGDGTTEAAIFRSGAGLWSVRDVTRSYFGGPGDWPLPGDYDGDGRCESAIFRKGSGLWAVQDLTRFYFGNAGDQAVPGDYNADGAKEAGLFRAGSGLWALREISRIYFGSSGDCPVPADCDGDGTWEVGIFRSACGLWSIRGTTKCYFGSSSDAAVPGDYDGQSGDEIGIFRENSALWAIQAITRSYFGASGDIPATR